MTKQVHAFFSGHVQNVGFRFTTQIIAKKFPIAGFVKNLSDGRVEVIAEGEEHFLQDFIKEIRESQMEKYIREVNVSWSEAEGIFKDFRIAY
jgi:acylphosphatase